MGENALVFNENSREEQFRYLYLNNVNLALQSSMHSKTTPLTVECIRMLMAMHHDLREEGSCNEIIIKSHSNGWIVGCKAPETGREFFLLLDESYTELSEIEG